MQRCIAFKIKWPKPLLMPMALKKPLRCLLGDLRVCGGCFVALKGVRKSQFGTGKVGADQVGTGQSSAVKLG